jgi:hypothetical protein
VRTPTRRTPRLLGAATPRPRFPGKQTSSCPGVFADDPALRLLSGSSPTTRHGVRNNFKMSLLGWSSADPHETVRPPACSAQRPLVPSSRASRRAAAQGCLPRIPRFVCCRGPPLPLGTASAIISKSHFWCSRLLGAATSRPRFPGKQTSSCPRVLAEDPTLRLLSGSTPPTRHGVRNNFKRSLMGGPLRDPHETDLPLARRSDPSTPPPLVPGSRAESDTD